MWSKQILMSLKSCDLYCYSGWRGPRCSASQEKVSGHT